MKERMAMNKPHVLVIGAGIGGLSAAVALKRAGCTVEVHERALQLRPVGAGLTIQPNAMAALRILNVGNQVEKQGHILPIGGLALANGTYLNHLPEAQSQALITEVGAPAIGIHRATLHEILLEAAGPKVLHLGRAAVRYEFVDSGVQVFFSDGSVVTADALIGADGVHSICRRQLLDDGEPVYAGYFCWRGVAPLAAPLGSDWAGEVWGETARFGGCQIDGGRFYWFVVTDGPAGQKDPSEQSQAAVLKALRGFGTKFHDVIRATAETAIFRSDISDRDPVTKWGEAKMTLLGDAAHAMTPNLGQGACQAIEDALVLALQMHQTSDISLALRNYEKIRQTRVNRVVLAARRLGQVAHFRHPLAKSLRNGLLRLVPNSFVRKQLADAWKLPYQGSFVC